LSAGAALLAGALAPVILFPPRSGETIAAR